MGVFDQVIPLDPGAGGQSIGPNALQDADIIVSTTSAAVSGTIRAGTFSPVSHAALYIGGDEMIEAIGQGVVRRGLAVGLADDTLAVAYRSPKMSPLIARAIIEFALRQVGQPYNYVGVATAQGVVGCRIIGPRGAGFFCSQLVIESYRQGGLPLTDVPATCIAPSDVVTIAASQLRYVGHLKGSVTRFPILSP